MGGRLSTIQFDVAIPKEILPPGYISVLKVIAGPPSIA